MAEGTIQSREHQRLRSTLAEANHTIDRQADRLRKLWSEISEHNSMIDSLREQAKKQDQHVAEFYELLMEKDELLKTGEETTVALEGKVKTLQEELEEEKQRAIRVEEELTTQLKESTAQVVKQQNELKILEEKLESQDTEHKKVNCDLEKYRKDNSYTDGKLTLMMECLESGNLSGMLGNVKIETENGQPLLLTSAAEKLAVLVHDKMNELNTKLATNNNERKIKIKDFVKGMFRKGVVQFEAFLDEEMQEDNIKAHHDSNSNGHQATSNKRQCVTTYGDQPESSQSMPTLFPMIIETERSSVTDMDDCAPVNNEEKLDDSMSHNEKMEDEPEGQLPTRELGVPMNQLFKRMPSTSRLLRSNHVNKSPTKNKEETTMLDDDDTASFETRTTRKRGSSRLDTDFVYDWTPTRTNRRTTHPRKARKTVSTFRNIFSGPTSSSVSNNPSQHGENAGGSEQLCQNNDFSDSSRGTTVSNKNGSSDDGAGSSSYTEENQNVDVIITSQTEEDTDTVQKQRQIGTIQGVVFRDEQEKPPLNKEQNFIENNSRKLQQSKVVQESEQQQSSATENENNSDSDEIQFIQVVSVMKKCPLCPAVFARREERNRHVISNHIRSCI